MLFPGSIACVFEFDMQESEYFHIRSKSIVFSDHQSQISVGWVVLDVIRELPRARFTKYWGCFISVVGERVCGHMCILW